MYEMIDEQSSSSLLRKTISELQMVIELTIFWWPVISSNHWATKTQVESQGASSTHMCNLVHMSSRLELVLLSDEGP